MTAFMDAFMNVFRFTPDQAARLRTFEGRQNLDRLRNYSAIDAALDDIEMESFREIVPALEEARDEFIAYVERALKDPGRAPEWVNNVEFDPGLAFGAAVERMFLRSWEYARDMLFERRYREAPNVGKAPDAALRYFRTKRFWVTGIVSKDLTREAQGIILSALKTGEPVERTVNKLHEAFGPFTGKLGDTPEQVGARLRTIVRTNVTDAYNHGVLVEMRGKDLEGAVKAIEYVAVLDTRTTELCRFLDGTWFRKDDARLDELNPPNHFNALAAGTMIRTARGDVPIEEVDVGDLALTHRGRWRRVYAVMSKRAERIRRLSLSSGRDLLATDEHPVLTRSGWARCDDLDRGDELFEHCQKMPRTLGVAVQRPDDHPTLVDEPVVAYDVVRLSPRVPLLVVDLKDHPVERECEVRHERPDLMLEREHRSGSSENVDHQGFGRGRVRAPSRSLSLRHLIGVFLRGGWVALGHALRRALRPLVAFLSFPERPVLLAASLGDDFGLPVRDGDLLLARAGSVAKPLDLSAERGFPKGEVALDAADRMPLSPMPLLEDSEDIVWVHASIIAAVEEPYSGDVWNIAVEEDETYVASGVIVHNCRSLLSPVLYGQTGGRYLTPAKYRKAKSMIPPGFGGK